MVTVPICLAHLPRSMQFPAWRSRNILGIEASVFGVYEQNRTRNNWNLSIDVPTISDRLDYDDVAMQGIDDPIVPHS